MPNKPIKQLARNINFPYKVFFMAAVTKNFLPIRLPLHGRTILMHHRVFHRTAPCMKPETDFRSFLDALRSEGDLADIDLEVDPHLEVGAIARRVSEVDAKAPLFHSVKGARQGLWKMVANMQGLRKSAEDRYSRIALGLGLPSNSSWKEINDRLRKAKYIKAEPSRILATCPCKENKLFGIKIDLIKLPAPKLHQKDGGNYVQTYGSTSCSHPTKNGLIGPLREGRYTTKTI